MGSIFRDIFGGGRKETVAVPQQLERAAAPVAEEKPPAPMPDPEDEQRRARVARNIAARRRPGGRMENILSERLG